MSSYDRSSGAIFWVDLILFVEVPADTLGTNGRLGPYEGLHTLQSCSRSFPDKVASN